MGSFPSYFHVLDKSNGEWSVAANISIKTAYFQEVTNKSSEISRLITNKLAALKKEDLSGGGSDATKKINSDLEAEANRLFSGNPIQGFHLWLAMK